MPRPRYQEVTGSNLDKECSCENMHCVCTDEAILKGKTIAIVLENMLMCQEYSDMLED